MSDISFSPCGISINAKLLVDWPSPWFPLPSVTIGSTFVLLYVFIKLCSFLLTSFVDILKVLLLFDLSRFVVLIIRLLLFRGLFLVPLPLCQMIVIFCRCIALTDGETQLWVSPKPSMVVSMQISRNACCSLSIAIETNVWFMSYRWYHMFFRTKATGCLHSKYTSCPV